MLIPTRFDQLPRVRATAEQLARDHAALRAAWNEADTAAAATAVIRRWDEAARRFETQRALASIHFCRNTADEGAREDKEYFDALEPEARVHALRFLQLVVDSPHRAAIERDFGAHALALWKLRLRTFDPRVSDLRRRESALENEYNALVTSVRGELDGELRSLTELRAHQGSADRALRLRAARAQDAALASAGQRFDELYDELVHVRHRTAEALGYERFTPLGYARMQRTDYGPDRVAAFRAQVREHVVPVAQRIAAGRARALGVSDFGMHDEGVPGPEGAAQPQGGHDWMLERAGEMFDELGDDFGEFYRTMCERGLFDLEPRSAKVGGGFCQNLPEHGVPFVLANFTGTDQDVRVFLHECGHAYQCYWARDQPLEDYLFPTLEACEIHSMSLEYLAWPHMERFFGSAAERYRRSHLEAALLFLPYGCAVDEFQHRVYAEPGASPAERAEMWRDVERIYMPWRRYDGMPHMASGRVWQRQLHPYLLPFYYIDYCLALCCALQMWRLSRDDHGSAMERYRALCARGGSASFTDLVRSAGLSSPFEPDCLVGVVADAVRVLDAHGAAAE